METVLVVFTALLRREGENQPCQGSLVREAKLWLRISCAPSAQAGEEPEGVDELCTAPALGQKVISRMGKSKPRAALRWKGNTRQRSKAE